MSTRTDLHNLVQQFNDKQFLKCCVTLKTDIDHTPIGDGSRYLLETDDATIKALAFTKEQQDGVVGTCEKLISLCFKKTKVIKFTSKQQVRTYVFQAYKDFLVTIRNHGKGHWYQAYEITITIPK